MDAKQKSQTPGSLDGQIRDRDSVRTRLLGLALGVIFVSILVTTVVGFDLASNVIRRAQQTSSDSLRAQAQAYLVQINNTIAGQNNLILDRAEKDVKAAAESGAAIFNGNLPADYWPAKEKLQSGPDGQLMNSAEDTSSVFVSNTQEFNDQVARDVESSAYMDLVLPAIKNNNPNAAAIYFGTEHNVTRYYPNIMLGEVLPADFNVTERPWYISARDENSGKAIPSPVWSDVYQDATGLGLVTTIAMPVYNPAGQLIGVVGLDLTLDEIRKNIETTTFLKSGYSFLVDGNGNAIVLAPQGYQDLLGRDPQENEFGTDLNQPTNAAFAAIIQRMREGASGFGQVESNGKELFVAYAPLESTGWSLGSVVTAQDVLQSVTALEQDLQQETRSVLLSRVVPIGILISVALLLLTILMTNRLVKPIQQLAEAAEQIGAGQRDVEFPVQGNDEIAFLARTLDQMAAQIRQSFEELETRVAERTQQLEKRTLQIQTAAEVGRDITQSGDLEALLENSVNLISDRFGYYNVGIFLVDEAGEFAHLRAASGDLGKILLEKNIKLRVGQQGIVGYVTQFGQLRVSGDVQADEMYKEEPLLRNSRSEAAIPLLSLGRSQAGIGPRAVIGVLDVQSTTKDAFTADDITVFQILADQLATAIQNLRLVNEFQTTLKELNLITQRQARDAWRSYAHRTGGLAYIYDRMEVKPALPLDVPQVSPSTILSSKGNERLVIPIRLREQVIGLIGLESEDPEHRWTEDEIAVLQATAEQAALTVENARLLAESQQKAFREQMTGEITTRMRSSLDMETVLRTAMNEIAQRLGVAQVEVQLGDSGLKLDQKEQESTDLPKSPKGDGRHE